MQSEQINELAAALAKAQSQIEGARADKVNPHFRSKYADLASCWAACREPLTSAGLAVVQIPFLESDEPACVGVRTVLIHQSGQWIDSTLHVPVSKPDAQGIGSALSYARRYSLCAMVGIAQEDDDGNAAVSNPPAKVGRVVKQITQSEIDEERAKLKAKGESVTAKLPGIPFEVLDKLDQLHSLIGELDPDWQSEHTVDDLWRLMMKRATENKRLANPAFIQDQIDEVKTKLVSRMVEGE